MEGDDSYVGESTKGETFLVVEERMSKCLASAGLLLIPWPIRENDGVWSQFGPKLQNLITHDSVEGFFLI